ncbi:MAG: 3-methyl-2-oxobutanoate dehydrogenase subunit VorB [Dehalococcoidia bacterium]|nr:3-methyl-2-oxobutanoate dehydrogenase subunit VorB [Dehalococcoidia bacterium]
MPQRMLAQGNAAIGWGAVAAGCRHFFGYPITPQNEITEWFAKELPQREGIFLQGQCETGSINMVLGAAATGVRVMTSTSSPGWALMQETISHMVNAELPCVISLVQRGGPGQGTTQHAQMDYLSATRGGGNGGYKNVVLTPATVQENHDFIQLAFHIADKYLNPVVLLTDGLLGQLMEPLELKTFDFGTLAPKDWAVVGMGAHGDKRRHAVACNTGLIFMERHPSYLDFVEALDGKFRDMESEVRYESYHTEDASLVLVAYGYCARVSQEAVDWAREEGLAVGLLRPMTVWPFPSQPLAEAADRGASFLVVEDSLGQMVDDVRLSTYGKTPVHLLNMLSRHMKTASGMILPETVFQRIKDIMDQEENRGTAAG